MVIRMAGRTVVFEPTFAAQALFLWRDWEVIDDVLSDLIALLASADVLPAGGVHSIERVSSQDALQLLFFTSVFFTSVCGRYVYLVGAAILRLAA
jgi:hypothetical protein